MGDEETGFDLVPEEEEATASEPVAEEAPAPPAKPKGPRKIHPVQLGD